MIPYTMHMDLPNFYEWKVQVQYETTFNLANWDKRSKNDVENSETEVTLAIDY